MVPGGPQEVIRSRRASGRQSEQRCPDRDHGDDPTAFVAHERNWGIGLIICPECDAIFGAYGPER
ncbi:MAG: hypothetical protein ABEJ67_06395 [Halanaeroarchaeum sp.]